MGLGDVVIKSAYNGWLDWLRYTCKSKRTILYDTDGLPVCSSLMALLLFLGSMFIWKSF